MTVVTYKDYQGEVTYEDGRLTVQILHIDDLVTTQVDAAPDVEDAFAELVNDYIATCESLGREPCKSFKGSFNVRMTPALHRRAAMAASACGDTLNGWVVRAIEKQVSDHQRNLLDLATQVHEFTASQYIGHRQPRKVSSSTSRPRMVQISRDTKELWGI